MINESELKSVISHNSDNKAFVWFPHDMQLSKEAKKWANLELKKRNNIYKLMPDESKCFATMNDQNVKLILFCHGVIENKLKKEVQIQNVINNQNVVYTTKSTDRSVNPIKQFKTPIEMALFLKENGLDLKHKIIELASCYSNFYAMGLQQAMVNLGYTDITVFGYHGEFIEPNLRFLDGLANLDSDAVRNGILKPNTYTDANIERFYNARLAKVGYGNKALVDANKTARTTLCTERVLDLAHLGEEVLPPIVRNSFNIPKKRKAPSQETPEANSPIHEHNTRCEELDLNTSKESISRLKSPNYANQTSIDSRRRQNEEADLFIDSLDNLKTQKKTKTNTFTNQDFQSQKKNDKDPEFPKPF